MIRWLKVAFVRRKISSFFGRQLFQTNSLADFTTYIHSFIDFIMIITSIVLQFCHIL